MDNTNINNRKCGKQRIKNQPQNVVGADIGIYRPDISEENRKTDRTGI